MNIYEIVFVLLVSVVLGIVLVYVCIASFFRADLRAFDRYKTSSPKHYQNLKWVCRSNGPMVALLCIGGFLATPFIAFDARGGVVFAVATLLVSAIFLRLSVRWFIWSLRP